MKRKNKKPVECVAWRIRTGDNAEHSYRLQTENADLRSAKSLLNEMDKAGWSTAGEIAQTTGSCDYVFAKSFKDEDEWTAFATGFKYPIEELVSTSDKTKRRFGEKKKKTKKSSKKSLDSSASSAILKKKKKKKTTTAEKKRGRKKKMEKDNTTNTGKENKTVDNTTTEVPTKKKKRGRKLGQKGKCSYCGEYGHNVRTCAKRKADLEKKNRQ